jgi:PAS domain S-box-containing protein
MHPSNGCDADWWRERAHFALAERAANFGYWRYDLTTKTSTWSAGMYTLLGTSPDMQPPDSDWLLDQIADCDRAAVDKTIAEAIATKSAFYYRTHAKRPGSVVQIVDTHGHVDLDEAGNVIAVLGVCSDVTKQVVAEAERVKAEDRYRLIAEEASDAIILYAPRGRIHFASNALERITGRTVYELEERRFLNLVHPDDMTEAQKLLARPAPDEVLTATYRLLHSENRYVWLEVTTRAVYDDKTGEFHNTIAVLRDISQRKEQELEMKAARERAEAANRAKSVFLANMSHELRTPLNAIIGFSDMMRQKMFGPLGAGRYDDYAALIHDSGQLLLDLISDLLDMAKIEAGKADLHYEPIDVKSAIDDCLRLVQTRASNNGVEISLSLPNHRLALTADRRAVKQVLLNLLSNAVKFTMEGGKILVSAAEADGIVTLHVRDNGIGIPASDLPRLGRPFEQVCADPMLAKAGTGLGLALVRALVNQHGGTMRIESEEGLGTDVTVTFPTKPPALAAAAA